MNLKKLEAEQEKLSKKVILKDNFEKIKHIAGTDQAYFDNYIVSIVAVLDFKSLVLVDKAFSFKTLKFPYVSGFLSYRVAPSIIEAYTALKVKPDLFMVNASGIAHPKRFGLASHLGLALNVPSIGVSKKLTYGAIDGDDIICEGEKRGVQIKTKDFAKPLFVNPGYRISIRSAKKIFDACLKENKLPEPLRIAHKLAIKKREELRKEGKKPQD